MGQVFEKCDTGKRPDKAALISGFIDRILLSGQKGKGNGGISIP
jgi:hypothetical protein